MIKTLILEDEVPAQEILESYIAKTDFVECLGVFESGLDIPKDLLQAADVLFLDIQLPEMDGLSFVRQLAKPPKIIITSAYPNYALEAFEIAVLDYLLKPFPYKRFTKAIERVISQIDVEGKTITVYANKTYHKLKIADLLYLKAEVDYVSFVGVAQSILVLDSLKNWEEKLSAWGFVRVHRSFLVNSANVEQVMPNKLLVAGRELPVSRTYKHNLQQLI